MTVHMNMCVSGSPLRLDPMRNSDVRTARKFTVQIGQKYFPETMAALSRAVRGANDAQMLHGSVRNEQQRHFRN